MKYGIIFLILGCLLLACGWMMESRMAQFAAVYSTLGFLAVGIGYLLKLDAVWLKRRNGTLGLVSFAFYLPLHVLNWLSLRLATCNKNYPSRHELVPNLWFGRRPFSCEAKAMLANESWAVVDLTAEFSEPKDLRRGKFLCLPTLDHTAPTPSQIKAALRFIAAEKATHKVLVHCALGHGRSATIVAAWLLQNGLAKTVADAESKLREIRSGVRLKSSQRRLLDEMLSKNDL
ncbi:MAG: dual specificity protein phosphatase family protein [Verrucomicrobiota bacterium]